MVVVVIVGVGVVVGIGVVDEVVRTVGDLVGGVAHGDPEEGSRRGRPREDGCTEGDRLAAMEHRFFSFCFVAVSLRRVRSPSGTEVVERGGLTGVIVPGGRAMVACQ